MVALPRLTFLFNKHTKSKEQAPGPGGSDRTRREAFNAPNESSVAARGVSLVTKQAGRVPQHDYSYAPPPRPPRGGPRGGLIHDEPKPL